METMISAPLSFAQLVDPASALAAVERAAKWNLPRRVCQPLDRRNAIAVSPDVAAYDADVEETTVVEEEQNGLPLAA